jgi:hypothetical protein
MDLHELWVERVVSACRDNIVGFDPESQAAMRFHRDSWLRWNPADTDLSQLLGTFKPGIHRRDLRVLAHDLGTAKARRIAFMATLLWGAGETNRYSGRHAINRQYRGEVGSRLAR